MKLWLLSSIGPPLVLGLCAPMRADEQPSFLIVGGTGQPRRLEENNPIVVALVYLESLRRVALWQSSPPCPYSTAPWLYKDVDRFTEVREVGFSWSARSSEKH